MLVQGELPIWNANELEKIEIGAVNECPPEGSNSNCRLSKDFWAELNAIQVFLLCYKV